MGDLDDDLPVVADAATGVPVWRRWLADPLPLMLLVGVIGVMVSLLGAGAASASAWVVPALFGVVVAGLALSGST